MGRSILFVLLFLPAVSVYAEEPEKILENKCTLCHSIDRIKVRERKKEEWEDVLTRMTTYGAVVSGEEKEILIEYLTITYGTDEGGSE
ncbi:MAG: hypothetical protein IH948_05470 [Bacteroidetes bacterium]|nr:hypothetical protein [Bacteroidota bacterium]